MTGLEAPYDEWAERTVVACAVASGRGAALAGARLNPDTIWNPRLARLFSAALELPAGLDEDGRVRAAASCAGMAPGEVRELVDGRAVMWDTSGGFAMRVLDAARRRSVMTLCARVYNELGRGARLAEVAGQVRQIEEAACL